MDPHALRDSVAGAQPQIARIDSILAGLDVWERVFAAPILGGEGLSRALALEGNRAFDAMAHPFQGLVAEERRLRLQRRSNQSLLLWITFLVGLGSLGIAFVAIQRLTAGLQRKAAEAAERQRVMEDQSAELGQQAELLAEQADRLEEQTETLREKVAERDHTLALLEETSHFLDAG